MKPIFPIEELRRLAAVALDWSGYAPAESARIRAIPDVRTIRYYTTLGLIDGPAEMQGRTAFYTLRHVEQLVAIKRLQARGLTLADVQQEMLGLSAAKLARLADLPDELENLSSQDPAAQKEATPSQVTEPEPAFWKRVPKDRRQSESGSGNGVDRVWRIKLDEHTTLEVNAFASGIDVAKIREAARPLIDELIRQQLIQKRRSNPSEVNDE
ncbi:MAG: helix-turn-helix domain-containing protein [Pirellulaceae bacterium]|nr:helix-turn-helix domain-containing protein [Pirellulaceae bacterium]